MPETINKTCPHGRREEMVCIHCAGLSRGQNPRLSRVPNTRFFGPVDEATAAAIVELMLDAPTSLEDTLTRFARGDIEPRELAYEIQIMMENEDERIKNSAKEQSIVDMNTECGAV